MPRPVIGWTAGWLLILPLGACAPPRVTPTALAPVSLVGAWTYAELQENGSSPLANTDCETDFGVVYEADGTFSGYEEAGTWHIDGGDLVETVTRTWEMGVDEVRQVERPQPSRIRLDWKSPDIVNLVGAHRGRGYALIRCRQQP